MTGHIVRSLKDMSKVGIILGNQAFHPILKVAPCARVGVFHDHEATAGMAAKHSQQSFEQARIAQNVLELPGDLVGSLAAGLYRDVVLMDFHALCISD